LVSLVEQMLELHKRLHDAETTATDRLTIGYRVWGIGYRVQGSGVGARGGAAAFYDFYGPTDE
jgi:hypothetical protein